MENDHEQTHRARWRTAKRPTLEKAYQFALWLVPTVEKFPRSQKFLLGDRLQSLAYDVIDGLVEAVNNRDREKTLKQANRLHALNRRRYWNYVTVAHP
jgi:hypothetical protein